MNCQYCSEELTHTIIDLKTSPTSHTILTVEQLNEPETHFPLKLYICSYCFLVQKNAGKKPDALLTDAQMYISPSTQNWLAHAKKYSQQILKQFKYNKNSLIVEVASNDVSLLPYFKEKNIPVLSIQSSYHTKTAALQGISNIPEKFTAALACNLKQEGKKADLLIGNNVLNDTSDINNFVEGLKIVLAEQGVITMEFPHLLKLIEECQFDTIFHENCAYLSFTLVKKIFEAHGLQIFDVEELQACGDSLRIFACHAADPTKLVTPRVQSILEKEQYANLSTLTCYKDFEERVNKIKFNFLDFLVTQKQKGAKVIGYGAVAKTNAFLNYCGIKGNELIKFVADAAAYKHGKFLPGSHIPVYSEEKIQAFKPDYIIIFPYNLQDATFQQLSYVSNWGGKAISFIPDTQVYVY